MTSHCCNLDFKKWPVKRMKSCWSLALLLLLLLSACGLRGDGTASEPTGTPAVVESEAAATSALPVPPAVDTTGWLDASIPGMAFGGSVLYYCHGLGITEARSAAPEVREALVAWSPEGGPAAGLVAVGELRWPAPTQTLADLETLANAGLQADLCVQYADFWPASALTPPSDAYITALARLTEAGEWQVRVALVKD